MGSNLSPVLANLYMEYFECVLLPSIKPAGMFWFRYVDDIFTLWDDKWGPFGDFLDKLNNLAPTIKFKAEWEDKGNIPFLDILICRNNGDLCFTVYRKPTHSGSYLHFFSHHSDKVKSSVASGLFLRAYRICSPHLLNKEIDLVKSQLIKLAYPPWFLDKALSKARASYYNKSTPTIHENCHKNNLKLPYNESTQSLINLLPRDRLNVTYSYPNSIYKNVVNVHQRPKVQHCPRFTDCLVKMVI